MPAQTPLLAPGTACTGSAPPSTNTPPTGNPTPQQPRQHSLVSSVGAAEPPRANPTRATTSASQAIPRRCVPALCCTPTVTDGESTRLLRKRSQCTSHADSSRSRYPPVHSGRIESQADHELANVSPSRCDTSAVGAGHFARTQSTGPASATPPAPGGPARPQSTTSATSNTAPADHR